MKHFASPSRLGAVLALAAVGVATLVLAQRQAPQTPTAQQQASQVKIKAMSRPGNVTVSTPDFQVRGNMPQPLVRRPRDWAVIDLTYEVKAPAQAGKWTDNVSVTFYVMADNGQTKDGKPDLSLYTLTVQYVNVPDGERRAGAVLHPSTLDRYGKVVAIACEITVDGAAAPEVSFDHSPAASFLNQFKNDWWKNDKVVNADFVKKRNGLLLERSQTPFGLVNIDDYEAVR